MVSPSRKVAVVLTVLGIMLLAVSATVLGNYYFGHGRAGRTLSSAPLPPGLAAAPSPSQAPAVSPTAVPERLGVPVTVIVADHPLPRSRPSGQIGTGCLRCGPGVNQPAQAMAATVTRHP